METEISINKFMNDPYENCDDCFNFFDWFCKDSALENRMLKMIPKLRFLLKEGIICGDSLYVWFKNNCPMCGTLYDDMRFSTLSDNEDFRGGICPKTGHNNEKLKCSVWYFAGEERELIQLKFTNWSEFKKEVKNNPELKLELTAGFRGEL